MVFLRFCSQLHVYLSSEHQTREMQIPKSSIIIMLAWVSSLKQYRHCFPLKIVVTLLFFSHLKRDLFYFSFPYKIEERDEFNVFRMIQMLTQKACLFILFSFTWIQLWMTKYCYFIWNWNDLFSGIFAISNLSTALMNCLKNLFFYYITDFRFENVCVYLSGMERLNF